MNELGRMQYLDALGIENYVSRRQLPGAAPSRRLVIVRRQDPVAMAENVAPPPPTAPRAKPAGLEMPSFDSPRAASSPAPAAGKSPAQPDAVQFSLAAIFVGQIAWLEQLQGNPLAKEQVQLIHAMARAVSGEVGRPEVTQFDWPPHRNRQLDLGAEAAGAAVAGFLGRQLEQRKCRGLVLLGDEAASRVPLAQLDKVNAVTTASTLDMLSEPARKRQAWKDLQPLVLRV